MPSQRRETSCVLVERANAAILLDAGTGIRRFVQRQLLMDPGNRAERIDVCLSHFHLDHIVGLTYLPALEDATIHVWAPGRWLYQARSEEILGRLLHRPLFPDDVWRNRLRVREMRNGEIVIETVAMALKAQLQHSDPSVAMRVGDELTYCTDTAFDPTNGRFASGCIALLHEAWAPAPGHQFHSSVQEAMSVAEIAAVDRLILTHIDGNRKPPELPPSELLQTNTSIQLGADEMRICP